MDIKKLEQMGMEQGFSHVAPLDCDTIELIPVINIISAGAVLQDAAHLKNVRQKYGVINMELLFRLWENWRTLLMEKV